MAEYYKTVESVSYEKTHLKNTYLITHEDKLIPHPLYIFGDAFARSMTGIYHVFAKRYRELYPEQMELIPQSYHEVRKAIDEVLKICDPKASYGYVKDVKEEGMYCPDSVDFFNTSILRRLFELIQHPIVDEEGNISQTMEEFNRLWEWMQSEYDKLYEPMYAKRGENGPEPTPPKTVALGLQLDPDFYDEDDK